MTCLDLIAAIRERRNQKPYKAVPRKTLDTWLLLADVQPPPTVEIISGRWELPTLRAGDGSTMLKLANATANAGIDAVTALLNDGYLRVYSGTQPTDADTAVGAQVLLAELRFGNPAFDPGVAGEATYNAVTADSGADADGTAAWFRALQSDGTTVVLDGNIGTADADLIMAALGIVLGAKVAVA